MFVIEKAFEFNFDNFLFYNKLKWKLENVKSCMLVFGGFNPHFKRRLFNIHVNVKRKKPKKLFHICCSNRLNNPWRFLKLEWTWFFFFYCLLYLYFCREWGDADKFVFGILNGVKCVSRFISFSIICFILFLFHFIFCHSKNFHMFLPSNQYNVTYLQQLFNCSSSYIWWHRLIIPNQKSNHKVFFIHKYYFFHIFNFFSFT